ncbi:MAG: hypothetical protein VCC36_08525 [Gammaproteobacteria bacterium]
MWDAEARVIMHSLTIPRAVCVLAGGAYDGETDSDGRILLTVSAGLNDEHWQIV